MRRLYYGLRRCHDFATFLESIKDTGDFEMVKNYSFNSLLYFLLFAFFSASASAASLSDKAKEKRWEDQIVPDLFVGEAVKLKGDGDEFLAIYTEASADKVKGGVIVLHGIGVHPAWADVVNPLRTQLAEQGWHTISLQLPILENEAKDSDYAPLFKEVPARIQAGVDYLKSKGAKNIAIAGHSLGAAMTSYYLVASPDPAVKAFAITSGGPGLPGDSRMDAIANFKNFKNVHILDLRGGDDTDRVNGAWKERGGMGNKIHGKRYESQVVPGANHFYNGKDKELVEVVGSWLDKVM
jgi:dienelactone hydrolase